MTPEIAVILTTFERPRHLERALASIRAQRGLREGMELVVADDGSRDETPEIVAEFARAAEFPVGFTTHPHDGFHPARSRNEGVRAATAPYLLFVDCDTVLPPRHVETHLKLRRPRTVRFGEPARLSREASEAIGVEGILEGRVRPRVPTAERRRRKWLVGRAVWHDLVRDPLRPTLYGNDFAVWRSDFEAVNGFDERYRGWGCEDVDLGRRLRRAGVRLRTILHRTRAWHLWHPRHSTAPNGSERTPNRRYLHEGEHPIRCAHGLVRAGSPRSRR